MKKQVAFFFNSPYLGGAERSLIYQIGLIQNDCDVSLFIPFLDNKKENKAILSEISKANISQKNVIQYQFEKNLYQISRSSSIFSFLNGPFFLPIILGQLNSLKPKKFDYLWANGNKVGFVLFLWAIIFRFKNTFTWHFRDYPSDSKIFKVLWSLLKMKKPFSFKLIGNSYDVTAKLRVLKGVNDQLFTVYNPLGLKIKRRLSTRVGKVLGNVSMFSPWKGLHEFLLFISMYESELQSLGVEKVKIFGGEIYQTSGEHMGHESRLKKLIEKLKITNIEFCGLQPPEDIYSQIDILIHSSLRPEPFGRVIIESFAAGVPVISTGLGGARELLGDNKRGLRYYPHDFQTLFNHIQSTFESSMTNERIEAAYEFSHELNELVSKQLKISLT